MFLTTTLPSQGDDEEQKAIRTQRDAAWKKLDPYWPPLSAGGQDMTMNRMPDHLKVDLVNDMARPPANWHPCVTLTKTETKVSTARHEHAKNPTKGKRKVIARTSAHSFPARDVMPGACICATTNRNHNFNSTKAHNLSVAYILRHVRPPCVPLLQHPRLRSFPSDVSCVQFHSISATKILGSLTSATKILGFSMSSELSCHFQFSIIFPRIFLALYNILNIS
jgi:hypothetical protein